MNDQETQNYLKSMMLVALITVVSMISVRYFISYSLSPNLFSPSFTSQQSQDEQK